MIAIQDLCLTITLDIDALDLIAFDIQRKCFGFGHYSEIRA